MDERESRRQELLREIATRFQSSAEVMRQIAKRIGDAAQVHKANHSRFEKTVKPLGQCVEAKPESLPFTYLEFLEFSSAEEFSRFRDQPPITSGDIERLDWDALSRGLLE